VEAAYHGVQALSSGAAVCDQQNVADRMMDLAHSIPNNTKLVHLTEIYAQQPRSSPDGRAVLYCQNPPRHTELRGLYPCQYAEYDLTRFTGGLAIGARGTIPYGLSAPVNPAGSCPDHSGPVPSGSYLQDPSSNHIQRIFKDPTARLRIGYAAAAGKRAKAHKSYSHVKRDDDDDDGDEDAPPPSESTSSDSSAPSDASTLESPPAPTNDTSSSM